MPVFMDLTGKRFNSLVVISMMPTRVCNKIVWKCRCDCDKTTIVIGAQLTSGKTKSCGCLKVRKTKERFTTHGKSRTPIYGVWASMIERCHDPNCKRFKDYGARGIKVCREWRESFEQFFQDMAERAPRMTLERLDNSKGYSKSNCKWATYKDQARNSRRTRLVTYAGKTQCILDWAIQFGVDESRIRSGLNRGRTMDEIIARII